MKQRAKIKKKNKVVSELIEYKPNSASENAECIHKYEELKVELWCDKHYHNRLNYGDSNGKREGIEVNGVQHLIINSFKYLLDIYLRGIQFKFINYFNPKEPKKTPIRIILKTPINETILNVVAEIHYLETSKFEITVITAMSIDDFRVADGQYSLMVNKNNVVLRRNIRKNMDLVHRLSI